MNTTPPIEHVYYVSEEVAAERSQEQFIEAMVVDIDDIMEMMHRYPAKGKRGKRMNTAIRGLRKVRDGLIEDFHLQKPREMDFLEHSVDPRSSLMFQE